MATSVAATTTLDLIHAYRRVLRAGLQAVRYSSPARYVVRDQVRSAFREGPPSTSSPTTTTSAGEATGEGGGHKPGVFDAGVAKRTAWFLEAAGRDRGVEHRVVKNLIKVRSHRAGKNKEWRHALMRARNPKLIKKEQGVYDHYDMTVAMLNKSLGVALR